MTGNTIAKVALWYTNDMNVRIDIDTRTFIRFGLVIIGFALAALAIYSALTALIILGVSFFLALALNIPVSAISKRLPGRSRVGATALAYLAVVGILIAVIMFVVPPIVQQTARFAQTAPAVVDNFTSQWGGIDHIIEEYQLRDQVDAALASIQENASTWAANVGQGVVTSIGSVFSFMVAALLALVLTFLMLIEGPAWKRRLFSLYSDQSKMIRHKRVLDRMYKVVTGYVTGQLLVSAIGAGFSALAVVILSFVFPEVPMNLAMVTIAIAFVFSLIPMFGATIAGVLISVLLAFNSIWAGVIFGIFFVVYQQIENNLISPHIQARKIDLSALVVLVAVTIGIYVFGILGGIIAIPIAGCIRVLIEEYLDSSKKQRKVRRAPLAKLAKRSQGEA